MNKEQDVVLGILVELFCLDDLIENRGNYGYVERQVTEEEDVKCELKIVDFRVIIL